MKTDARCVYCQKPKVKPHRCHTAAQLEMARIRKRMDELARRLSELAGLDHPDAHP